MTDKQGLDAMNPRIRPNSHRAVHAAAQDRLAGRAQRWCRPAYESAGDYAAGGAGASWNAIAASRPSIGSTRPEGRPRAAGRLRGLESRRGGPCRRSARGRGVSPFRAFSVEKRSKSVDKWQCTGENYASAGAGKGVPEGVSWATRRVIHDPAPIIPGPSCSNRVASTARARLPTGSPCTAPHGCPHRPRHDGDDDVRRFNEYFQRDAHRSARMPVRRLLSPFRHTGATRGVSSS